MFDPSLPLRENPIASVEALCQGGFALAMQLLGNRDDALEIVQDAVRVVLQKRSLFTRQRGELRAWFLKIVRNACLDRLRRKARQRVEDVPVGDLPAPTQKTPDQVAEEKELLELLQAELQKLPSEQREIILLRDYHGLSYAEIAQVLSIPAGTVMSRLHRARSELRQRMQSYR